VDRVANQGQRLLVVQRTGWGKSVVYFPDTKILRDKGAGPTLLISPLLPGPTTGLFLEACSTAIKALDTRALDDVLQRGTAALGAFGLLQRVVAPPAQTLGDLWVRGRLHQPGPSARHEETAQRCGLSWPLL
jgi:hypothetical protein